MITPVANYIRTGRITHIVDGDTVDAEISLGFGVYQIHRLRLLRVNTPEINSPDATLRAKAIEAKEFLIRTVMNREVILETIKSDSFGRYLAEVYCANVSGAWFNLSDELLATGFATAFKPRQ